MSKSIEIRTQPEDSSKQSKRFSEPYQLHLGLLNGNNAADYEGKGKDRPLTGHESAQGEQRYSSTLSLTSALDGVGGQRHAPAALPAQTDQAPLVFVEVTDRYNSVR
jgi:hypothetical protein